MRPVPFRVGAPRKTSLTLCRAQILFLDRLRARIRRDSGALISRSEILEALVSRIEEIDPARFDGVRSEGHLRETLREGRAR